MLETEEEQRAAAQLKNLGGAALKLLMECVEKQELTRVKVSAAARALEDAGFIFIRPPEVMEIQFRLLPSLSGEEALDYLLETLEPPSPAVDPGHTGCKKCR